jgi:hypothetical protein
VVPAPAVARIVADLCANPVFAGWEGVLEHTLAAHRAGLDCITTQALVPIIEEITMPVLAAWERACGQIKPKERFAHNHIPATLEKYVGDLPVNTVYAARSLRRARPERGADTLIP